MRALHTCPVQGIQMAGSSVGNGKGINASLLQPERIRQNVFFHPALGAVLLLLEAEGYRRQLKLQLRNIGGIDDKSAFQQVPAAELRFNGPGLETGQELAPLHGHPAAPYSGTVPLQGFDPGVIHVHVVNRGLAQHGQKRVAFQIRPHVQIGPRHSGNRQNGRTKNTPQQQLFPESSGSGLLSAYPPRSGHGIRL